MFQRKLKILVVEDNKHLCEILDEFISEQPDMEVIGVACDGMVALEMILKKQPDIVLMDVVMPELDGLNAIGQINKLIKNNMKFFILSTIEIDSNVQNMFDPEAVFFIMKPVDLEVLIEKIRKIVSAKHLCL